MRIFARWALTTPERLRSDVVVTVEGDRISDVTEGRPLDADRVVDLLTPGYANCHSHAFHRGLRGRVNGVRDDFWSWRDAMYALAARLDPDRYRSLATLVFREMLLAGFTSVGEFHYLHRDRRGVGYADSNAMGNALIEAAGEAGIRLGLIDVCYLYGGLDGAGYRPLEGVQRRFGDRDVEAYLARVSELPESERVCILRGVHSLRAVSFDELARLVAASGASPWHMHLMEQPKELEAIVGYYGERPLKLLAASGLLSPTATLVHLNQLAEDEVAAVARSGAVTCACPTTEEDLGDGLTPAARLLSARGRVSVGTDQHVRIDPFAETGRIDAHERLRSGVRTSATTSALWSTLFAHDTVGFEGVGRLEVGALADMVAIDLNELGIAGAAPEEIPRFGTRSSVVGVWVAGELAANDIQEERRALGRRLRELIEHIEEEH